MISPRLGRRNRRTHRLPRLAHVPVAGPRLVLVRLAGAWIATLLALAPAPACAGEKTPGQASQRATPAGEESTGQAPTGPAQDPCDPASLELSAPHGAVLDASRLVLRWRSTDKGPFLVSIQDENGKQVYRADTYGHELRVLVSPEGASADTGLRGGRSYRWRVVPQFAPDPSACPTAEFRLLSEAESGRRAEQIAAAEKRLGVGDEDREPGATIELARTLVADGFYDEAERRLLGLVEKGYEEPGIKGLLEEIYRKGDRRLSLEDLPGLGPSGERPF
jgi:hypothetical protein